MRRCLPLTQTSLSCASARRALLSPQSSCLSNLWEKQLVKLSQGVKLFNVISLMIVLVTPPLATLASERKRVKPTQTGQHNNSATRPSSTTLDPTQTQTTQTSTSSSQTTATSWTLTTKCCPSPPAFGSLAFYTFCERLLKISTSFFFTIRICLGL